MGCTIGFLLNEAGRGRERMVHDSAGTGGRQRPEDQLPTTVGVRVSYVAGHGQWRKDMRRIIHGS